MRHRWLRNLWHRWRWLVIAGLALVAFGLGVWGFERAFEEGRSFGDKAYASLQLFTLESGSITAGVPWQLEVARVLAPLMAVTAALTAVAAVFRDELRRFYARHMVRDHVVICGLGECGTRLTTAFRDRGSTVVAIEVDHERPGLERVRDDGVIVLNGDAVETVRGGGVSLAQARAVIAVCGDDRVNAEVALATREALTRPSRRLSRATHRAPVECFVHIDDPDLCRLLEAAHAATPATGDDAPVALQFFNPSANAAPALLADHSVVTAGGEPWAAPAHMLIVGLGQMGNQLLVHAARCWRALHSPGGPALGVTVVDLEADDRVDALLARTPQVKDACDLTALRMDVGSASFDEAAFLGEAHGDGQVTCVYVCLDDDARGLGAALSLHHTLAGRGVPVVVRTAHRGGLAALLRATQVAEYEHLHAFGLVDRVCRPETLLDERNELLARALHEWYVRRRRAAGISPADDPHVDDWDRLPDAIRESNRRQAEHLAGRLRAIGCGVVPLGGWDSEVVVLTDDEVKALARDEHDRWRAEREHDGWTFGVERDLSRKFHPALVAWDDLPDDVRAENQAVVRALPIFLVSAGFLVVRGNVWEIVARAIHEDYVRNQRLEGKTPQTNPSMVEWDALPETLKASNRDQARDIGMKLGSVGCIIVPMTQRGVVPAVLSRDEVERLAEMEHDRWWREREADGWTFAPAKDVERKHSPYLVPYEDLPESVKEYDRNTVRGIPAFVRHAGFAVVREAG